jgi:hypothetical protein
LVSASRERAGVRAGADPVGVTLAFVTGKSGLVGAGV